MEYAKSAVIAALHSPLKIIFAKRVFVTPALKKPKNNDSER